MKTLLKKLFIPPFSGRLVSSVATRIFGRGIPVFLLHRISAEATQPNELSSGHLRRCLQYLVDNDYTFISLENMIRAISDNSPLPDKAVVFTMDDGFLDQAEIAVPLFLEFNCPLTFFIISDLVDQQLWPWDSQVSWIINNTRKNEVFLDFSDERLHIKIDQNTARRYARELTRNYLKEVQATELPFLLKQLAAAAEVSLPETPPAECQAMSWDKARELEGLGVQFAPHSKTHRILSRLDRETAADEILGSWHILKDQLTEPLNVFCYPTGRILDFGPREKDILRNNGFIGAVTTIPGYVEPKKDVNNQLFALPRFDLPNNMTDFIQYCSWIERAKHAD